MKIAFVILFIQIVLKVNSEDDMIYEGHSRLISEPDYCKHIFITGSYFPYDKCSLESPLD